MHKGDEPDALVDLFDSDHLACEDLAQVDLAGLNAMRPQLVTTTALSWKG